MEGKALFVLFLAFLSLSAFGADCSFLRSYVERSHLPVREVSFNIPPAGLKVTRVLPTETTNPQLKELFEFTKNNRIVITKGPPPVLAGENTIYIGVTEDALKSESALIEQLQKSLRDYAEAPLNTDRLPAQSQLLVQRMKENFRTRFINEGDEHGMSYINQNMIGIKTRHPDNLRVNSVVFHEITHNTTDRKVYEALNPKAGEVPKPLTGELVTREMKFKSKPGKSLNLPGAISGYNKFYRSDEIEALLREMAQSKHDGLTVDTSLKEMRAFMDSQEMQIRSLLKNKGEDLRITTEAAEPELMAGRRQRRTITTDAADFEIGILVPRGLSVTEERAFIEAALKERLERIESYRRSIARRFQ